ncbi:PREDICTED: uncharacterized protein LOC109207329 [Nicotiana attenuata]|uniref:Uncharacterized protein n=1 Tax=Nicotiana attenuata TaxID=49451 RepID=A0A314KT01_NICAT|nr:PREDICTED: uncharacterized protein LOC109207329 [Nicotiana attenuata]OIT32450.1 hypothetical protein A4A49_21537 [Nicotiana attenuata]
MTFGVLSPLGTALTIIFVISLLALFAQLFFILWRRRNFRRNIPIHVHRNVLEPSEISSSSPNSSFTSSHSSTSKELLLFFCLRTQTCNLSRVGPNSCPSPNSAVSSPEPAEMELIDLLKLQGMYGPSRFLFTIKEEEKEDLESEKSLCSSAEKTNKSMSLQQCMKNDEESPEMTSPVRKLAVEELPELAVTVDCPNHPMENQIQTTPFSTPCDSPLYLTPLASPIREASL